MADRDPKFPVDELKAAAGQDRDTLSRIDALHRELNSDNPAREAIDEHVEELRKHPSLITLLENWFLHPRTQEFIDELSGTGL